MSKTRTPEQLVSEINKLLEKHEVHNEVLATELAILVMRREKTILKKGHRITMEALNKAFKKG